MPNRMLLLLTFSALTSCAAHPHNDAAFAGFWVNEHFYHEILKVKSPTHVNVPLMSSLYVPESKQEPAVVTMLVKQRDTLAFRNKTLSTWMSDLKLLPKERLQFENNVFVRIDSGYASILETILFKGRYHNEKGGEVVFTADNEIKGLPGLDYYSARLDYTDEDKEFDRMWMGATLDSGADFSYRFSEDTLCIYTLKSKGVDSTEHERYTQGTLAYRLVKE
jgi:hypothetical protein